MPNTERVETERTTITNDSGGTTAVTTQPIGFVGLTKTAQTYLQLGVVGFFCVFLSGLVGVVLYYNNKNQEASIQRSDGRFDRYIERSDEQQKQDREAHQRVIEQIAKPMNDLTPQLRKLTEDMGNHMHDGREMLGELRRLNGKKALPKVNPDDSGGQGAFLPTAPAPRVKGG